MRWRDRFRRMLRPAPPVHVRRRQSTHAPTPPEAAREDRLRSRLGEDPNDAETFNALAEIVRRRAAEVVPADPLTAAAEPASRAKAADTAHWALAEELAGMPRAWYPLIEMARLSLAEDRDGAMRRLAAACDRERDGRALAEGIRMLREAHLPGEALSLGVGHWAPAQQGAEVGQQVVRAALEAGRTAEARRHLKDLAEFGGQDEDTARVVAELEPFVAAAEETPADQ